MRPFCTRISPFCCRYTFSVSLRTKSKLPRKVVSTNLYQCPIDVTLCNDSSRRTSRSFPAVFPCKSTAPTARASASSPLLVSLPTSSRSQWSKPVRKQSCEKCPEVQFERYSAKISDHKQQQHHASISNQVTYPRAT